MLVILVLAWDMHKHVAELNRVYTYQNIFFNFIGAWVAQ